MNQILRATAPSPAQADGDTELEILSRAEGMSLGLNGCLRNPYRVDLVPHRKPGVADAFGILTPGYVVLPRWGKPHIDGADGSAAPVADMGAYRRQ